MRQVILYFYHEPASGIGLPEISLSGSTSDLAMLGDPLIYTILDNQDLTVGDAQVRNLTLALTEPITEPVNRFHIQFSLTDNIQQFAVSEVQLCSNESKLLRFTQGILHTCMWLKYLSPTAVTIEAESLTLELESEPLTGPHILLPANRTQVNAANMSLSCSVTNQGRFRWQWTSQGYSPQVSDDTRTSMIEIPLTVESVGEYTCTASYHPDTRLDPSPVTGTFTVDLESKSIKSFTHTHIHTHTHTHTHKHKHKHTNTHTYTLTHSHTHTLIVHMQSPQKNVCVPLSSPFQISHLVSLYL